MIVRIGEIIQNGARDEERTEKIIDTWRALRLGESAALSANGCQQRCGIMNKKN